MSLISLAVTDRDGDAIGISLSVKAEKFMIIGFAYFGIEQMQKHLACLSVGSVQKSQTTIMAGGYFNDNGSILVDEHVSLKTSPFTGEDRLLLTIKAFVPDVVYGERGLGRGGCCHSFLTYPSLSELVDGLRSIFDGSGNELEFRSFLS